MKRSLKLLHEIGTVGVMGAVASMIVLSAFARDLEPDAFAVARAAIHDVSRLLLLPSLALVLVSGFLAMGWSRAFHGADWVWVKALMTPLVFESTVVVVDQPARAAAEAARAIAAGDPSAQEALAVALRQQQWGLWLVLFIYTANVVLSIWRPRRSRKPAVKKAATPAPAASSPAPGGEAEAA